MEQIDSRFLDPIMYTLIDEPMLLPNSQIFVDFENIRRHLMTNSFDPFTKQALTWDELQKFNDTEQNRMKREKFKEDLSNHLSQLKNKKNISSK